MDRVERLITKLKIRQNLGEALYWKGKLDAFNALRHFCCFKILIHGDYKSIDMCTITRSESAACSFKACPYMKKGHKYGKS